MVSLSRPIASSVDVETSRQTDFERIEKFKFGFKRGRMIEWYLNGLFFYRATLMLSSKIVFENGQITRYAKK